jgi:hypothetical protein
MSTEHRIVGNNGTYIIDIVLPYNIYQDSDKNQWQPVHIDISQSNPVIYWPKNFVNQVINQTVVEQEYSDTIIYWGSWDLN